MTIIEEMAKRELPSGQNVVCGCGFRYTGSARWDELIDLYENHECYPESDTHWTHNVFSFWPCMTLMFVIGMVPLIIATIQVR